jgi:purine catabolism regulator
LFDNDFNIKLTSKNIKDKLIYLENEQFVNAENLQLVVDGIKIEQDNYIINRIKAGNNSFGYLMVVECNRKDENILVALNQASLLLASEFHKNRAILEKEKNYLNSFIREMLENNISSKTEAVNKAKSFGWELEFPQVIIDLKLLVQDEKIKRENYEKLIEEKTLENIISKKINIELRKIKSAHIDDSLIIFVNVGSFEYNKEILMNIATTILNELKYMGKIGIGISKRIEKINELPLAYKEAKNGIEIGKALNKDSFLIHYEDFRVINLIKEIKDITLLKNYVNEKLGKLIEYDNSHDLSLMNTLKGVLDTNFNLQKTAKNMYIHYNTLRYRMEKLRELGINIDDGFEIGEIVLAYNIYIWFKSKGEM